MTCKLSIVNLSAPVCRVNADVVFVLDSSGSIGPDNFEKVINFTVDFATELFSDTESVRSQNMDKLGVVLYSTNATSPISLTRFTSDLIDRIRSIQYTGGWTNTPEGICQMANETWGNNTLRLAIVLTDGMANRNSTKCGTLEEAAEYAKQNKSILIYAIGVGEGVNDTELVKIASGAHFVDHVESFNNIQSAQESTAYEICFTG